MILSHGVLHLPVKEVRDKFIRDMQVHTKAEGFHVIGVFTNRLPATPDNAPFTHSLFDVGELPLNMPDGKSYITRKVRLRTAIREISIMSMLMSGLLRKGAEIKLPSITSLYTFHKPYIILMSHKTEAEKDFHQGCESWAR